MSLAGVRRLVENVCTTTFHDRVRARPRLWLLITAPDQPQPAARPGGPTADVAHCRLCRTTLYRLRRAA